MSKTYPASPPPRIAVIVSADDNDLLYFGKTIASAINRGRLLAGSKAVISLGFIAENYDELPDGLHDLSQDISLRPYVWHTFDKNTAAAALDYARRNLTCEQSIYIYPDDGIAQFFDCDLWIILGDSLATTLLPLRPYIICVSDYWQRYGAYTEAAERFAFLHSLQQAHQVWALTEQAWQDSIQYAGVTPERTRWIGIQGKNNETIASECWEAVRQCL